ncbi:hypothetical protein F5876DRAFT_71220 [Lentinula aff. lateritia]|uniref:Uncharacterized protein n=1 Tax=Lentinula aff. lateritia TaxID=2804960 RepID=A0ACC1TG93_9AGAR|nr:hypothetical protein F5876DRAFT_71220 [Lentinula aff. lateritia]
MNAAILNAQDSPPTHALVVIWGKVLASGEISAQLPSFEKRLGGGWINHKLKVKFQLGASVVLDPPPPKKIHSSDPFLGQETKKYLFIPLTHIVIYDSAAHIPCTILLPSTEDFREDSGIFVGINIQQTSHSTCILDVSNYNFHSNGIRPKRMRMMMYNPRRFNGQLASLSPQSSDTDSFPGPDIQHKILLSAYVGMSLAGSTTVIRLALRVRNLWWDDVLALLALISLIITAVAGKTYYGITGKCVFFFSNFISLYYVYE